MNNIYICNTSSDTISEINLNSFKESRKINLNVQGEYRVGPHGICKYENNLVVANSFSNDISILNLDKETSTNQYFIGMHCNDVKIMGNEAYVICGDLNSLLIFDLIEKKIIEEIPCGNSPHSIDIDKKNGIILISNFGDDTITLIDVNNKKNIQNIRVGAYPSKALFSTDGEYIFVCESNLGMDCRGSIAFFCRKNNRLLNRVAVGNSPVDFYCTKDRCYVSNFGDGTISIVDTDRHVEENNIIIGGMPRGIVFFQNIIYVCDNYNNLLISFDLINLTKKSIPIGREPTGIILS